MRPSFQILGSELCARIIAEARLHLCTVGVTVQHPEFHRLAQEHGAQANSVNSQVIFTDDLITTSLRNAVRGFCLYDRAGNKTHDFEAPETFFAPGSAALSLLDPETGEARKPTTSDYIRYVKVVEGLPHLAAQATAFVPQDIPEALSDAWRLYLSLVHGSKPVITGAFSAATMRTMHELLVCARGSESALREKPLAVFTCCPTTPLKWSPVGAQNLLDCARAGIPVELVAMPLSGFTAPATLTGTLIQHTVEILSGAVLAQLAAPGTPMLYGTAATSFDVRFESTPSGAIESMMLACGVTEIGHALGLPTQAYIGLSDAKAIDAQAGMETGSGATMAALAGINQVSGPGMLDFINCMSLEKLVVDNEACGMARRLGRGIEPKDDFPAAPLMQELLSEQHLLIAKHTRRHYRTEHYIPGPVIDRMSRARYAEESSPPLVERARREVERLVSDPQTSPIADETRRHMNEIMGAAAKHLGVSLPLELV